MTTDALSKLSYKTVTASEAKNQFGQVLEANPGISIPEANSAAWLEGKRLLERAIAEHGGFAFETTLGGATITRLLADAMDAGIDVHVWYVALSTPELHLSRVRARVL